MYLLYKYKFKKFLFILISTMNTKFNLCFILIILIALLFYCALFIVHKKFTIFKKETNALSSTKTK